MHKSYPSLFFSLPVFCAMTFEGPPLPPQIPRGGERGGETIQAENFHTKQSNEGKKLPGPFVLARCKEKNDVGLVMFFPKG